MKHPISVSTKPAAGQTIARLLSVTEAKVANALARARDEERAA